MVKHLVVPNAWQARVHWQTDQYAWSNIYGLDVGILPANTQGNTDDIAGVFDAAMTAHIKGALSTNVTLESVVVTDLRAEGAPQFTTAVANTGTDASQMLPLELAACLTLKTGFRSKKGRGRSYLTGFCEDANDGNGKIVSAYGDAINAFADAVNGGLHALGFDLGVISLIEPAFGFTGTIRPVVDIFLDNLVWKAQRRRRAAP